LFDEFFRVLKYLIASFFERPVESTLRHGGTSSISHELVHIFRLVLLSEFLIFLIEDERSDSSFQIYMNIHAVIDGFSSFLLDFNHLFGIFPLILVDPSIFGELVPVSVLIDDSKTLHRVNVELNQFVSMT
jgi:hypothetical protein